MNKIHEWVNTAGILLIAILVLVGGNEPADIGANGTRFPHGISANNTSPVAGEVVATSMTTGAQGTVAYETKGGIAYAFYENTLTASSSVMCISTNPFTSTSTPTNLSIKSTNVGIAQANNLYIATTSAASPYATTSPNSWNQGFAMGTGEWSYNFAGNVASTTDTLSPPVAPLNVLEGVNGDASSNYIVKSGESIVFKIGTSTPGSFVSYDEGTCSVNWREL